MQSRRLEALTDGVFAIAMVLLVLQVPVPSLEEPVTGEAMLAAITAILPTIASFAVSFLILGTLWVAHHRQYQLIREPDTALVWSTLFLLLCVAFLPFATALLARYPLQRLPMLVYGGTLLLAGLFLFAHWSHAVSRGLVSEEVTPEAAELVRERISMGMAAYLAATIVGAFLPKVGLVLFACVPVLYLLPVRIDPALLEDAAADD